MHTYIVFAHPTRKSFTGEVLDEFCRGLNDGGHSYEIGDLYEMDFKSELSLEEYNREMNVYGDRPTRPIPPDILAEHAKIKKADGLTLIFPVWWSDCPAKLKGWFDRVWVCGYTYVYRFVKEEYPFPKLSLNRSLVLCPAGNTLQGLQESGIAESMRRLFVNDRLRPELGILYTEFVLLAGMANPEERPKNRILNLKIAYDLGKTFLMMPNRNVSSSTLQ